MSVSEVFELAKTKGFVLQMMVSEDGYLYWVENPYAIGRPFPCLDDLIKFLKQLPNIPYRGDTGIVRAY